MGNSALSDELNHFVAYATIAQGIGILFVAAAFIVSLRQMKKSNTAAQMTQYQGAVQLMLDWRSNIIADPKLVEEYDTEDYFKKAFKDVPIPTYFHTIKLLHIFEHCWLLNDRGVIPSDLWQPWSNNICLLMRRSKERDLWKHVRTANVFNGEFVKFVDGVVTEAERKAKPGKASTKTAADAGGNGNSAPAPEPNGQP